MGSGAALTLGRKQRSKGVRELLHLVHAYVGIDNLIRRPFQQRRDLNDLRHPCIDRHEILAPYSGGTPMSSFHSSGRSRMKFSISEMHRGLLRTTTSTPSARSQSSRP